jgi:hypothetical protein
MSIHPLFHNGKKRPKAYPAGSFSCNQNYVADKLLCNRLRTLLKIKVGLAIAGILLIIPILIAGILVVKHLMM